MSDAEIMRRVSDLEAGIRKACENMHHARWCSWNDWERAQSECNCGAEALVAELRALAGT